MIESIQNTIILARVKFIEIAPYIDNMIRTYTHQQKKIVEKVLQDFEVLRQLDHGTENSFLYYTTSPNIPSRS